MRWMLGATKHVESPMRIFVIALAAIALLTAPVHARGKGSKNSEATQQTEAQKKKNVEAEKAYKDALRSIPEQKVSDPWAKVR